MKARLTGAATAVLALAGLAAAEPAATSIRTYHIGNSLTFGAVPGLPALFKSRGIAAECGWHVLWGSSLHQIWEKAGTPSAASPHGAFTNALSACSWDVLTLQPWGTLLDGDKGDVAMAKRFVELARRKSPDIQVFIYETWPFNKDDGKTFAERWSRGLPGPGDWDSVWSSACCKLLVERLNAEMPELARPVRLVPAGSAMAELDRRIRAGEITEPARIEELYQDNIHLNATGNYLVRCTMYAAIMKDSPLGLPAEKGVSESLARVIQEAAWKVVREHDAAAGAAE